MATFRHEHFDDLVVGLSTAGVQVCDGLCSEHFIQDDEDCRFFHLAAAERIGDLCRLSARKEVPDLSNAEVVQVDDSDVCVALKPDDRRRVS